ncbi:polymorphic toxin-type HINT domain-containing protein [Psychrobacter phenylpyruvicus]|uniref:polymorphic toxin-type HINT domain-containing protein n=1 Tax=Psychrobacter phenylpyruvicus TaxID=29432 RepID=UPI001D10F6FD|nr:polymorphic toxin-type HINT domain-containing protein [Psychrobacter phenylpyruvicus]
MYKVDKPSELTAEQKDTISNITTLAGVAIGSTTGEVTDAVNAGETAKVAVEDNSLKQKDIDSLLRQIAIAKRKYTGAKLDVEMRRIRAVSAKIAADNWKEIEACEANPTAACLNKIKADYSNVDFQKLKDAYREYQDTELYIRGYEQRNNDIVTCSTSRPTDCVYVNGGIRVVNGAIYELIGSGSRAGEWRKVPVTKSQTKTKSKAKTPSTSNPKNIDFSRVCNGPVCFTAGTLIHTIQGLKPIETVERGELVWSREEFGEKYDYRPVIATKVTSNAPIYEVKIQHDSGLEETFSTTEEHPFWIDGQGWRKASILEAGMKLLDKRGNATATVISQKALDETDTVYNFEVQDFSTYHIGELGVWVHNANCCDFTSNWGNIEAKFKEAGWVDPKTNRVRYLDPIDGKLKDFPDDVTPQVDHVLTRAEAKKIAGKKLTTRELNKIINAPENLMPLPGPLNGSKSNLVEYKNGGWVQYGNKGKPIPISPVYKRKILEIQEATREKINKAIRAKEGK